MLLLTDTRFPNGSIFDYPVLPSEVGFIEEGMALSLVYQNGVGYASRTTGSGTDQFLGVAFAPRRELTAIAYKLLPFHIDPLLTNLATALTFSDTHTVGIVAGIQAPAVYATNAVGTVTTLTAISTGAPLTGQYKVLSLAPLSILFSEADAGTYVNVGFNYVPTLNDVTYNLGWNGQAYGSQGVDFQAMVPVVTNSQRIVTDKFIAGEDWYTSAGGPLHVVAGGYFSTGTLVAGTDISGQGSLIGPSHARVLAAPNTDLPGLTIAINQ